MDSELEVPNGYQAWLGTDCDAPATSHFGHFVGERGRRRRWHARVPHRDEHHGFAESHMPLASRRHATYIGGCCGREDAGRNPLAAYVMRVSLVSTDRSLALDMPPQGSSSRVVAAAERSRGLGSTYLNGDLDSDGA